MKTIEVYLSGESNRKATFLISNIVCVYQSLGDTNQILMGTVDGRQWVLNETYENLVGLIKWRAQEWK